mmetsp:Transcript_15363/g.34338  ORF Transcript_15363/g.34338 Transcript_15363/m.34338 type:complete len:116 (-) Transcript_15363:52-399(-)
MTSQTCRTHSHTTSATHVPTYVHAYSARSSAASCPLLLSSANHRCSFTLEWSKLASTPMPPSRGLSEQASKTSKQTFHASTLGGSIGDDTIELDPSASSGIKWRRQIFAFTKRVK